MFVCDRKLGCLVFGNCVGILFVGGCEFYVLFDSGVFNCFIISDYAERSGIRSDAGERTGSVMVAGGEFLVTYGRAKEVDILVAGELMSAELVISSVELYDVIFGMKSSYYGAFNDLRKEIRFVSNLVL